MCTDGGLLHGPCSEAGGGKGCSNGILPEYSIKTYLLYLTPPDPAFFITLRPWGWMGLNLATARFQGFGGV